MSYHIKTSYLSLIRRVLWERPWSVGRPTREGVNEIIRSELRQKGHKAQNNVVQKDMRLTLEGGLLSRNYGI